MFELNRLLLLNMRLAKSLPIDIKVTNPSYLLSGISPPLKSHQYIYLLFGLFDLR